MGGLADRKRQEYAMAADMFSQKQDQLGMIFYSICLNYLAER